MEIRVAKTAGFCFGVKRAINLAEDCAGGGDGDIYTLGPIIHNPQVVKKLEESNVYARNDLDDVDSGTVIIRSHGVRLDEYESASEKGLSVVDATCPFVKKAQENVSRLLEEGYKIIVVGEEEHPEVQGLVSYGGKNVTVAVSVDELKALPRSGKIGIVAQTTQNIATLEAITAFCLSRASEVKVFNTICNATTLRQAESLDLAGEVDVMIVVGGKNSANTKRLAELCRPIQKRTYHIETACEIDEKWFEGAEIVGVTAGASSPRWIIEEVITTLEGLSDYSSGSRSEKKEGVSL